MSHAIEVKNVSFGFERDLDIVENISFNIPEKSTTILIGPNGSGKTTLLKIMVGLLAPTIGSVKIYNKNPENQRDVIGYVPQRLYFDQTFPITVLEFLKFSKENTSDSQALKLLKNLGIEDLAFSLVGKISGGQLQRTLIARSLLGNPKILFLDEPVSGIDLGGEQNFYDLIQDIKKSHGVTVVMVSHEINLVSKIADQVVCINKKMLCSGAPSEVLAPEIVEDLFGQDTAVYKHHKHHH